VRPPVPPKTNNRKFENLRKMVIQGQEAFRIPNRQDQIDYAEGKNIESFKKDVTSHI
jgi:hypothetical protein